MALTPGRKLETTQRVARVTTAVKKTGRNAVNNAVILLYFVIGIKISLFRQKQTLTYLTNFTLSNKVRLV
jgi:hypothetical protein